MRIKIEKLLKESSRTLAETARQADVIESIARLMVKTLRAGGKVLVCGNGGSAADSQHLACELVGLFSERTRPALPAVALTANTSNLTSIGNDLGFDEVFRRQVEALGRPGDLLVALSTSGNSPNVLKAVEQAKKQKLSVAGLTGGAGGKLKGLCGLCFIAPSSETPRIQEAHVAVIHILCSLVDEEFSGAKTA